jgi:hypothetical protein
LKSYKIKMNINLEKKRSDYAQLSTKINSKSLDFANYYK